MKGPHSWGSNGGSCTQVHVCIYYQKAWPWLLFHLPEIIVIKSNSSSKMSGEISEPPHPAWREREFGAGQGKGQQAQRREGSFPTPLWGGRARKSFQRLGTNACCASTSVSLPLVRKFLMMIPLGHTLVIHRRITRYVPFLLTPLFLKTMFNGFLIMDM